MHGVNGAPPANGAKPVEQVGSIATRAMLVKLSATAWSAAKIDARVSRDVAAKHGSSELMGDYRKRLLAPEALKKIRFLITRLREVHRSLTLPWLDAGPRLLLTAAFLEYEAVVVPLEEEIRQAVADLVADWDAHKAEARRQLNGLYDESDYPPVAELAARFTVGHSTMLINSAQDARIGASQEVADAIRAKAAADERAVVAAAMQEVRERIEDVVGRMADRCAAYGRTADGSVEGAFRDTLVDNVRALAAVLPSLDLSGTGKAAEFGARIEHLCRYDAQTLRDSERARAEVAAEAQAIVDHVADLF
jgi:hypothetical protein